MKIDDWVNGKPDAWDYEAVLAKHDVFVGMNPVTSGWGLGWEHGGVSLDVFKETHARKCAALFVELWLHDFSASFASKIADGYGMWLRFQEEAR